MESHVYHCTGQSYVSVLSHCPTWDRWDSPMESHVYHCTGQSDVSALSHCPTSYPEPARIQKAHMSLKEAN